MNKTVVFIRHGRTELNARGVMISSSDPGLDATGEGQIRELASSLVGIPRPVLFCSPLRRALQSALILADELDLAPGEVKTDWRLRELGFGTFEGKDAWAIERSGERALWEAWRQGSPPAYPPEAETFEQAAERVGGFFREVVSATADNLLVVSHGHILRILIAACVLGGDPAQHRRLCLDHARIATLRWEKETPRLDCLNATRL
jgi:broad specificity phosphatase PhoE